MIAALFRFSILRSDRPGGTCRLRSQSMTMMLGHPRRLQPRRPHPPPVDLFPSGKVGITVYIARLTDVSYVYMYKVYLRFSGSVRPASSQVPAPSPAPPPPCTGKRQKPIAIRRHILNSYLHPCNPWYLNFVLGRQLELSQKAVISCINAPNPSRCRLAFHE